MREIIWLAPDREVYNVSILEEPWDEERSTLSIVFRCERTGWIGATQMDAASPGSAPGPADFPLLLRRARAGG